MSDMSINAPSATPPSAVQNFTNKIFDTRDTNQDGKVSAKEADAYSSKHPSAAAASASGSSAEEAAESPQMESAERAGKTSGKTIDVTA